MISDFAPRCHGALSRGLVRKTCYYWSCYKALYQRVVHNRTGNLQMAICVNVPRDHVKYETQYLCLFGGITIHSSGDLLNFTSVYLKCYFVIISLSCYSYRHHTIEVLTPFIFSYIVYMAYQ